MKKIIIAIVCMSLASSCGNKQSPQATDKMTVGEVKISDIVLTPPPKATDNDKIRKKVIKEGNISFETANINGTREAIYEQLKKLGGYIENERETNSSDANQKTCTIESRVPANNFDVLVSGVSENAVKIDSKNISTRDVTTQYIDQTTRLANKKKLEERYLELLKKGSKIADLLEIENKLTEIRSDIESAQGQLNYLNKQVEYSSLEITFYTKQTVKESGETFGYRITNALATGWDTLCNLFFSVVGVWPYWLILAGAIVAIRKWQVNIRKKKTNG